ncbi:conserved hypothetical protein [Theileria orientalis strain Shintoku]|uniref:Uncharacterized protein n=1 Tax=Theileria orientalis strain Shintoku TaxID=869250 RepID=J4C824_THEOR|nr:conserved hypothetical protein [Theileria orientalis strain Shintoku]PVC51077.1 hypothetical protein MACL_00001791 [Theileria orientalis]BAM40043.1 conserved hypothetical protein [Theileria orientalis strain Shintoku]|eukprot:XP_009690344.1 conserved hypothetical protein [Theileria orientalis strain Shintoku]
MISIIYIISIISISIAAGAPIDIADGIIPIGPKLAIRHVVSAIEGDGAIAPRLRFVHIAPKAQHIGAFADGIGCAKLGHAIKLHSHIKIDEGEILVELLGISDCKTWHAALLGVYHPLVDHLIHKAYAGIKDKGIRIVDSIDGLIDIIHAQIDGIHAKLFGALVKKGLPSHIFTIKLQAKLEHALKLYS